MKLAIKILNKQNQVGGSWWLLYLMAVMFRRRRIIPSSKIDACVSAGIIPHLAVVIVGDDPASHVYVGAKIRACKDLELK